MGKMEKRLTVRFDDELYEKIERVAVLEGQSVADTVRRLVERGLNDQLVMDSKTEFSREIASYVNHYMNAKHIELVRQLEQQQRVLDETLKFASRGNYVISKGLISIAPSQNEKLKEVIMEANEKAEINLEQAKYIINN